MITGTQKAPRRRVESFTFPAMLIILAGLPGVGKTTLARHLARRIRAMHIRIDSIEIAMGAARRTGDDEAGYRVGYAVAGDNLRLGHTSSPILLIHFP